MLQRTDCFFEFNRRFPDALVRAYQHDNGCHSEIRAGVEFGVVQEVFLGVYREDGSLRHERIWDEFVLSHMGCPLRDPGKTVARVAAGLFEIGDKVLAR
ncbi:hypothetical protein [Pseudomonas sp. PDM13]|uniref:hypothetical protein n=1 Tax=Pseudomonas sp. PDM13 TaxID=2769255 RepID=UPI0021E08838|nr:hypothetical protein [Pseudomonas sp. PDM13]MCU9949818.1 hypothetical protein [Pseudomonas sp. PDM13]